MNSAMKVVTLPMMQNAGTGIGFLEADDGCWYTDDFLGNADLRCGFGF